jgi:hypothetical protein
MMQKLMVVTYFTKFFRHLVKKIKEYHEKTEDSRSPSSVPNLNSAYSKVICLLATAPHTFFASLPIYPSITVLSVIRRY